MKTLLNPYLLALTSGILLILSFPLFDLGFLIWFALAPILYALANTEFEKIKKWRISLYRAQILGVLLGAVFYYGTLYWLYNIFGLFGLLITAITLLYTFFFAYILNFVLSRWKSKFAHLFFPAILWVAIEYFKSEGWWLKFSWMNLGYSQHEFLPILQCASIFGQYGLSFLIVLVNSTIVFLIMNRSNRKLVAAVSVIAVLSLGILLAFGTIAAKQKYEPDIKVGLVQDESLEFPIYARLTENLPADIDFILWPEYAIPEFLEEESGLLIRIKELTIQTDSYLILGAKDRSETYSSDLKARIMRRQGYPDEEIDKWLKFHNTAYVFSPKGEIIGKYYKTNPIQFFADGVAGKDFPAFETEFGTIGIIICYDADYSYVARKITRNGAEILFIPTYDAIEWSVLQHRQHSAMTSMRAVENGRFVARATTSGISQIIDPSGRVTRSIDIGESDITTGFVQRIDKMTFYTQYGFTLPYICITVSILIFVYALLRKSPELAEARTSSSGQREIE